MMLTKKTMSSALLVLACSFFIANISLADTTPACKEEHRVIAPKNPSLTADGSIVPGQSIVQAKFSPFQNLRINVIERPRSGEDLDTYNSTVVVEYKEKQQEYAVARLIKGGAALRLVEAASLCSSYTAGMLVLAFEAPSTGAAEGFVLVQYSAGAVDVKALPMVTQGKIVVHHSAADTIELWSTTQSDATLCGACKKRYVIKDCNIRHATRCIARAARAGPLSPQKFAQHRIEIR